MLETGPMGKSSVDGSQAVAITELLAANGHGGPSPKLRGLETNTQGAFGPRFWRDRPEAVRCIEL